MNIYRLERVVIVKFGNIVFLRFFCDNNFRISLLLRYFLYDFYYGNIINDNGFSMNI